MSDAELEAFQEAEDARITADIEAQNAEEEVYIETPTNPRSSSLVYFLNPGLLPMECITTFGVSVKVNDGPIGYFGTGLKYAIAVLLRNGCSVAIRIADEVYNFTVEDHEIRGKSFSLIMMNGYRLPFTTELGKNWELWQAYRELYSNCMDERGYVMSTDRDDSPDELMDHHDSTCIMVGGLSEVHESRSGFILSTQPKHRLPTLEIHEPLPGIKPGIFYKGIKVLELPTKYSYNMLGSVTLTEDRTCGQWEAEYEIAKVIATTTDVHALTDFLSITDEKYQEAKLSWNRYTTPSQEFMELVSKLRQKPHTLSGYYGYHAPKFLAKMDRHVLAPSVLKKLASLRKLVDCVTVQHEILLTTMDDDYQIPDKNTIILGTHLLEKSKAKHLKFSYLIAYFTLKERQHHGGFLTEPYKLITKYMLTNFTFDHPIKKEPKPKKVKV